MSRWERSCELVASNATQQEQEKPFGLPLEMAQFDRQDISSVLPRNARALHDEVHAVTESVPELITTVMLSSTAVATQCLFDVAYLDMIQCPPSIAGIFVAGSGSRKTKSFLELTEAHRDFQAAESDGPQDQYELKAELKIWEARERSLLKKIDESLNSEEQLDKLKEQYAALLKAKPGVAKTAANIMHKDVTYPSLARSIEVQSPCTSWMSEEATSILPDLRRLMPHLNSAWDGTLMQRARIASDPVYQAAPRFSICWGMQPKRWAAYVRDLGEDFVDVGMGPRALIAVCRPVKPNPNPRRVSVVREARNRHNANLAGMFNRHARAMRSGKIERTTLTLSAAAQTQFDLTLRWIAENRTGNGYLAKIPEFANRIAENTLRVAANLHVIEERQGTEIGLDILQSAIQLMIFYTEQHIALFGDINTPIEERHAAIVLQLLKRFFNEWEFHYVPYSNRVVTVRKIQQYVGTQEIRSKRTHVVDALAFLERQRIVSPLSDAKGDILGVTLNDDYFRNQTRPGSLRAY
ncbi:MULTISPECIES: DUF3987 domain-containing protein [Ralstonia]|nr:MULTISPECIES: DUF3987 domain-containing protein [Ralstonia]